MTPAENSGTLVSLKTILGDHFDRFIQDFIYEPVQKWAQEGRIDISKLKGLNRLLRQHGKDAFDLPAERLDYATKNTIEGGELLRVRLPITRDLVIDNFVKIFSNRERYETTLDLERRAYDALQGTELADIVVRPLFGNRKRSLVCYPFINAKSLAECLGSMSDSEKESALTAVIDDYNRVSAELSRKKDSFHDRKGKQKLQHLMPYEQCLDQFVFERLGAEKGSTEAVELRDSFAKYFGVLSRRNGEVINSDLNTGNVILQDGRTRLIDLEELRLGFNEFAYAKLLTKSGISEELEGKLARYAAESRAKAQGRTASVEEVEDSYKVYSLNRIAQEIFTAVRYIKRAKDQGSKSLENMAQVSYTIALRKIDRALEQGYVGADFKEKLETFVAKYGRGLHDLGGEFEAMSERFNPHCQNSQENVVSAPSLDLMLTRESSSEEMTEELGQLRKNLRKISWKNVLRRYSPIALPVLAALAVGAGALFNYRAQKAEEKALLEEKKRSIVSYQGARYFEQFSDQYLIEKMEKIYGNRKIAWLFYCDHKLTFEAMQETGTNNVDTLMDYIKKVNPKRAKELEWVAKEENQPKPDEWVSTMHYLARIYSNDTAAAMFLLDPKTTYEAMQETGSQDPEVLRDYLYKSNRQWLFFDARACTEGGVHDRIEREVGPSIAEKDYKIMLQEAEQAYKLKKSREQPIHSSILEEDAAKLMRGR